MNNLLDKIVSLAKRRGFVFPGSEIYGGISGFYDFGPLGVELKFNIKQAWWESVVRSRDDVVGVNAAIIMNPKVWESSGHMAGFSDPLVECKKCHRRYRPEDLFQTENQYIPRKKSGAGMAEEIKEEESRILKKRTSELLERGCENCGSKEFTEPRQFNLMFKTFVGPAEDSASTAYLRPETAGGIFTNFKNVLDTTRIKIPFGIAQIGKAFRNEINPKDFIFRTREFEQMELEYFVKPGSDEKWFDYWVEQRVNWYTSLGLGNFRAADVPPDQLAHYSKRTVDIEYQFPFGWQEIEGIANRTDFDLKTHRAHAGVDLTYYDEEQEERFTPFVIEPSAGVDRLMLAFLCNAYSEEGDRIVLKLHPKLAPYKAAVFPLLANKPPLVQKAKGIYYQLKANSYQLGSIAFDDRGNIGKRYYSQDEIGTPLGITVDFQTLEDNTVTVRDRDTTKQIRAPIPELQTILTNVIEGEDLFELGRTM